MTPPLEDESAPRVSSAVGVELAADSTAALVHGMLDLEVDAHGVRPWRLGAVDRRYAHPALVQMSRFTAGVRMRLLTRATRLVLEADVARLVRVGESRPNDRAQFVAVVDGEAIAEAELHDTGHVVVQPPGSVPPFTPAEPAVRRIELALPDRPVAPRVVEIWLPQLAEVRIRRLLANAPVARPPDDARPRWIHYGSSISHGGSAGSPFSTWPVAAAAKVGLDLVNLGMSGNAMLDPLVARAIAREDADLITLKVGINIVGADAMRLRTFAPALHGFLDSLRESHPDVTLALITPIACPPVETAPGPIQTGPDGRAAATPRPMRDGDGTLTLSAARRAIEEVVRTRRADDSHLHLIDGLRLLGVDEEHLLPDRLHPSPEGHLLIAERIAPRLGELVAAR